MSLPGAAVIEQAGLRCWPGVEVAWDGQWVRRAAGGYTQRANSIQSLDPADDHDAAARIADGRAWLEARGIRPTFRVTPLAGPGILAALDAAHWAEVDASCLFAMELGSMEADPRGEVFDLDDQWLLAAQQRLQGYSDEKRAKLEALLNVLDVPAKGIVLYDVDGKAVATSLMSVADGIVITGNVVTDATERRKGYGAAMMRTGLAWARSAGAQVAALNVAADNAAAQALYRGLGYRHQYDYSYRVPA